MRKQRGVIVLGTVIFLLLLLPPLPACLSGARPPPRTLLFICLGSSPPILAQIKQHPWVSERLTRVWYKQRNKVQKRVEEGG